MRLGRKSQIASATLIAFAGMGYALMAPSVAVEQWASADQMLRAEFRSEGNVRPLSRSAAQVALSALSLESDVAGARAFAALSEAPVAELDLGEAGRLQVAVLDDHSRAAALHLPFADEHSPLIMPEYEDAPIVAVNYENSFDAPGDAEHLDVSITQRAGVSLGEDGSAAGAGAELRVGHHLRETLEDEPRWYLFAGADRRALLYNPAEGTDFQEAMALTRREVVGDAQAGMAVRIGEVDLALSYVMRDYRHIAGTDNYDEEEQFAAVTVNWTW
ncbi:MAG: lipid A deacylase LpxR family protein [Alphaproteobacteria bacterium]|nr:lipid A deacylase LpxR family protein [Alphaproteobacteria bacterium]